MDITIDAFAFPSSAACTLFFLLFMIYVLLLLLFIINILYTRQVLGIQRRMYIEGQLAGAGASAGRSAAARAQPYLSLLDQAGPPVPVFLAHRIPLRCVALRGVFLGPAEASLRGSS